MTVPLDRKQLIAALHAGKTAPERPNKESIRCAMLEADANGRFRLTCVNSAGILRIGQVDQPSFRTLVRPYRLLTALQRRQDETITLDGTGCLIDGPDARLAAPDVHTFAKLSPFSPSRSYTTSGPQLIAALRVALSTESESVQFGFASHTHLAITTLETRLAVSLIAAGALTQPDLESSCSLARPVVEFVVRYLPPEDECSFRFGFTGGLRFEAGDVSLTCPTQRGVFPTVRRLLNSAVPRR